MAHFAQLDDAGTVVNVIVVHNNELLDDGVESEAKGIAFCQSLFGGTWKQTSYNGNIRKNYAGVGYTYDSNRDAFISAQPYPSWSLNESTCTWQAPVPMPTDNKPYRWDEEARSWVEITL
jgi:hypothetical protein